MSTEDKCNVMIGHDNGEPLLSRPIGYEDEEWLECTDPSWNWANFDYKIGVIVPAKPREFYIGIPTTESGCSYTAHLLRDPDGPSSNDNVPTFGGSDKFQFIRVKEIL